jgi:hypothetical protein
MTTTPGILDLDRAPSTFAVAARSVVHFLPANAVERQGPQYGAPERVIQTCGKSMSAIVANFAKAKAAPNFCGLLFDFNHENKAAAGWIDAIEQRPHGLFASVAWTPLGAEAIRSGTYRRVSPGFTGCEIVFGSEKLLAPEFGDESRWMPTVLHHISLVGDPLWKTLPPVYLPLVEAVPPARQSSDALVSFLESIPAHIAPEIRLSFLRSNTGEKRP